MREKLIENLMDHKIIAIARDVYGDECLRLAEALKKGGVEWMEVTFDQRHAEDSCRVGDTLRRLNQAFAGGMVFGAGTVTDEKLVRLAQEAGASFIVSPDVNEAVIRETIRLGMVSIPGAMTPTEVLQAHRFGADFVKLFPADVLGTAYIRSIVQPINHVRLLAFGGITEENVSEFLAAGTVGVGVGGRLVQRSWIDAGEWDRITGEARIITEAAHGSRSLVYG